MDTGRLLLERALRLKPQERFMLIEGLIQSLDCPSKEIDEIWIDEAERRLRAHREGKSQDLSYEEVLGDEPRL